MTLPQILTIAQAFSRITERQQAAIVDAATGHAATSPAVQALTTTEATTAYTDFLLVIDAFAADNDDHDLMSDVRDLREQIIKPTQSEAVTR